VPTSVRQDPIGSTGTSRQRQSDGRGPLASDTTAFPPLSPAKNFLPLFPAASFPVEEPASRRSTAINRGAVGGGETPKNNGRPPGDLGEAEGGGAAALPRR
jgi:hypothetical protein